MLKDYQPSTQWQGRNDSLAGERFFQVAHCVDLQTTSLATAQKNQFALLGFACDAGVKRNLGRPGAKEGPSALRQALANLALPRANAFSLYDLGDIVCCGDELESAQQQLATLISQALTKQYHPIVIGGGHEIAWAHYQGIRQAYPDAKLGIINFDAHFDLRPLAKPDQGSSGTPFLQIAMACEQSHHDFSYLCLGIQEAANTDSLWQKAHALNVQVISAQTIQEQQADTYLETLDNFILQQDVIYLTLCLDVFAATVAPGVSAPQSCGLFPWDVRPLLQHIIQSAKVLSFDIAELSPAHDINQQTAQLAATMLREYCVQTGQYRTII